MAYQAGKTLGRPRSLAVQGTSIGGCAECTKVAEARMLVIWLGVLFVLGGLLFMAYQSIWRGRLSDAKRTSSEVPHDTLEPRRPGAGFGPKANWPGLVLIV